MIGSEASLTRRVADVIRGVLPEESARLRSLVIASVVLAGCADTNDGLRCVETGEQKTHIVGNSLTEPQDPVPIIASYVPSACVDDALSSASKSYGGPPLELLEPGESITFDMYMLDHRQTP